MPLYEFECKKCGERFDTFLRVANMNDPQTCSCGSEDVQRLISVPHQPLGTVDSQFRKEAEDAKLQAKARKAKELKNSGQVPMEATIKQNDPRVSFL